MNPDLATLKGIDLRERLVASRLAVRDALAARPSIALRDAIAEADKAVSAAMREAIEVYESLAADTSVPSPRQDEQPLSRSKLPPGLPPPRRLSSARPVPSHLKEVP